MDPGTNAEIAVTISIIIDIRITGDYWLHLSDYSDMGEFLSACSDYFQGKGTRNTGIRNGKTFRHTISREWLCPNFSRDQDALEGSKRKKRVFISWSRVADITSHG